MIRLESPDMRAFIVPDFGEPGSIGERPTPDPQAGELLVRVEAASVNAMDPVVRAGWFRDYMEHRLPLTPGFDYAGTVAAVGDGVDGFVIGDEVFGAVGKAYAGEGSLAEFATVNAGIAAKRPSAVTPEQAASLPTAAGTALAAIDALDVGTGDTIAIVGAGGGVGGFAVELAARRGLRVIAITRGENNAYVRSLGAADVADYTTSNDEVELLRAKAPDGLAGVIDLFHDAAGAAPFAALVRPGGVVASPVAMGLDLALAGTPVRGVVVQAAVDRVAELGELAARGEITVPIEVVPFEEARSAIDRQASKMVRGKLVV
jgi:NADPH:quinone reductase-like Zn-dependent oxidoreductase